MINIFSSLFRQRKPRKFNFKPVYYNEEREAQEKRTTRIMQEINNEESGNDFRKVLHEKWRKNQKHAENKKSNTRVLLIAALLALICYLMLR